MEPYGRSLLVDDPAYVPARHFQNNRVPRDDACFTCHTNYTLFGDYKAKLRGLRHVYVNYIGTIPKQIKLYDPYNNRECLHCHGGARTFEDERACTSRSAPTWRGTRPPASSATTRSTTCTAWPTSSCGRRSCRDDRRLRC